MTEQEFKKRRKAYAAEYYQQNKEFVKAQAKKWRLRNKKRSIANARKWRQDNPDKRQLITLRHRLKKKYGISLDAYFELSAKQNDVCAICKQPELNTTAHSNLQPLLSVDHNHATGKVRGLLCKACNLAIGSMQESVERLEAAIRYLGENA